MMQLKSNQSDVIDPIQEEIAIALFDANFEAWVDSLEEAQPAINLDQIPYAFEEAQPSLNLLYMSDEEIVRVARDMVYSQNGRATVFTDVVQDMVEEIAGADIRAYAVLCEWRKSSYGYFLPIKFYIGATVIPVYVYSLQSDNCASSSYTVLIAGELIAFVDSLEEARIARQEEEAIRAAIKFASYIRSRILRGHNVRSHLLAYAQMVGDIWRTAFDRDSNNYYGKLNMARRSAIHAIASYGNIAQYPLCAQLEESSTLGALSDSMLYLITWRNQRRDGRAK